MALCRFANCKSQCWPSLQKIAKRTSMSRRQVIREIKKLKDLGLIDVIPQIDEETGEYHTNLYVLLDLGAPQTPPNDPHAASDDSKAAPGAPQTSPSNAQSLTASESQAVSDDSQSPKQNTKNKTYSFEKNINNNNSGGGFSIPADVTEMFTAIAGDEPTEKDRQYLAELATYPRLIIQEAFIALENWLDNPEKETIRNQAAWLVGTARCKHEQAQKRIQHIQKASRTSRRSSYEVPEEYRDIVIGYY
jgi:biotin operon repressor